MGGDADTNALEMLEGQHREVEELFAKLESADRGERKQKLFSQIADKLAIHASIEARAARCAGVGSRPRSARAPTGAREGRRRCSAWSRETSPRASSERSVECPHPAARFRRVAVWGPSESASSAAR